MKYKILIQKEKKVIFDGKPINLPIKNDVLIAKSIEMFNDEDPCIIHQTYVIESLVDELISKLKSRINEAVQMSSIMPEARFIDIDGIDQCEITLRGK